MPSETVVHETCRCRPTTHEGVAKATTFSTLGFSLSWCVLSAGWCGSTRALLSFSPSSVRHSFTDRCFLSVIYTRVILICARQIVVAPVQRSRRGGRLFDGGTGSSGKPANSVVSSFSCEREAFTVSARFYRVLQSRTGLTTEGFVTSRGPSNGADFIVSWPPQRTCIRRNAVPRTDKRGWQLTRCRGTLR